MRIAVASEFVSKKIRGDKSERTLIEKRDSHFVPATDCRADGVRMAPLQGGFSRLTARSWDSMPETTETSFELDAGEDNDIGACREVASSISTVLGRSRLPDCVCCKSSQR